jgi:DNA invertase Pin-like site-specific DNA recombinase
MLSEAAACDGSKLACVYIRQSTFQQVRRNLESQRRQRGLGERARELGWPEDRIEVIDDDQGTSGAAPAEDRPGFMRLLGLVRADRVGIVLAVEVSRLTREDVAWQMMVRHCDHRGVLLGDEHHVYDPRDPHQRMLLGMLATFASFELQLLRDRMAEAARLKAERGELYCACAPGYVVEGIDLVLSPDRRVRHVIDTVLGQYPLQPGASALCRWCCANGVQLPVCGDRVGHRIEWREATTPHVLRLLRNPAYAGAYVYGRTRVETLLPADGRVVKRRVKVPMAEWPVIRDHHPAYITWEQFEKNWHRLQESNPMRQGPAKHVARSGGALLSGLLHCRRCGYGLYVRYSGPKTPRYQCLQGSRQRQGRTSVCMSFQAPPLDGLVEALVLEVVRPAGVRAALEAEQELAATRRDQRRILADRAAQCRYGADRAHRQYDRVDPENRLVCLDLERRWNAALEALRDAENRLRAFDRQTPEAPTAAEKEELRELGSDLSRVWSAPDGSVEVRKQIVRLLIERIVVDIIEDGRLRALVHWAGGHHTEHVLELRSRPAAGSDADLPRIVDLLRLAASDERIAKALNRAGIRMPRGATWTAARVADFRRRHRIGRFSADEKRRRGLLAQEEAADELGVSSMTVHRLLVKGVLPGVQAAPGLPWVIEAASLELPAVRAAVRNSKGHHASPPGENPEQMSLWEPV